MDVGVALLALLGGGAEIHVHQLGLQIRRSVAVNARYRPVCPDQCERCLGMVEARQLFPGLGRVTRLATRCLPIDRTLHTFAELPAVRIFVAGDAGKIREVVNRCRLRFRRCLRSRLVAVLAGYREMSPGQNKLSLFVPDQAERGGFIAIQRVALLTMIQIWCSSELRLMLILVAIEAERKLDLVYRLFASRNMALCALQAAMLAL